MTEFSGPNDFVADEKTAESGNRPRRTCVLILGMHRSGTSALTRVLSLAGAKLPENLMGAAPSNKAGHWESIRLVQFHDQMLSELDSRWNDWRPLDLLQLSVQRRNEMKAEISNALLAEYGDAPLIVVKDPRICRFAPFFTEIVESLGYDVRVIVPVRNPLEVVKSIFTRAEQWPEATRKRFWTDSYTRTDAALLWLRHALDAEHASRGCSRAILSYSDLLADWEQAFAGITRATDMKWPFSIEEIGPLVSEFLSPGLRHHSHKASDLLLDADTRDWVAEAYQALIALSRNGNSSAAMERLDAIRTSFDNAVPLLYRLQQTMQAKAAQREGELQQAISDGQAVAEQLTVQLDERADTLVREREEHTRMLSRLTQERSVLEIALARLRSEGGNKEAALKSQLAEKEKQACKLEAALKASRSEAEEAKDAHKREMNASADQVRRLQADRRSAEEAFLSSTSWKLTAPMRGVKYAAQALSMAPRAVRFAGGMVPATRKAFRVFSREGLAGVQSRLVYVGRLPKETQDPYKHQPGPALQDRNFPPPRREYSDWNSLRETQFIASIEAELQRNPKLYSKKYASIVLPTYNRASVLSSAIDSVLAQTHVNWECIVVDDGSVDDTPLVMKRYSSDSRVKYIRTANAGVSAARNMGLMQCCGEYIFFLDSDNSWTPDYLRIMIAHMEIGRLDAAYSGLVALDDHGAPRHYLGDRFDWEACLKRNYIDLNSFGHRSRVRRGEEFDTAIRRLVDWDYILRITTNASVAFAPFIGVRYYNGTSGGRITNSEYIDGKIGEIMGYIRAKHRGGAASNDDAAIETESIRLDNLEEAIDNAKESTGRDTLPGVAAKAIDFSSRLKVRFFPDYRINNHYQTLVYRSFATEDVAPGDIDACLDLVGKAKVPGSVVFHLHWTTPIFAPGKDAADARGRVDAFLAKLKRFKELGGVVLWTMHNIRAHESRYPDVDLYLSAMLCDVARMIHVHDAKTVELASPHFQIPVEKVVVAQHGNYKGVFPDTIAKDQARQNLGIPQDVTVFAMFGQLRTYKGLDDLLDAFARLRQEGNGKAWLILAGKPLGIDVGALKQRCDEIGQIHLRAEYVPDEEVQTYLRASDVAVLPYSNILTSGSVFLAFSFDLPVIAPNIGLLDGVIRDRQNGLLYQPNSDGLYDSMSLALRNGSGTIEEMSRFASLSADAYPWEDMSGTLLLHLKGPLFGTERLMNVCGSSRRVFIRNARNRAKAKRVATIVLHFQSLDDTRKCVQSVLDQTEPVDVTIVSNSPRIEDVYELSRLFPDIMVVQTNENIGYAGGNNIGLYLTERRGHDYFWILNPDCVVPKTFIKDMLAHADEHPGDDLFGSLIVYGHRPDVVWFAGGDIVFDSETLTRHRGIGVPLAEVAKETLHCDYITGASVLGRFSALPELGYLPEDYFLYFEETDWCKQYGASGKNCVVFTDLVLEHHKRSENNALPTKNYIYYFCRNAYLFGRKYAPERESQWSQAVRAFSKAWLEKIEKRAPNQLSMFEKLVERAIEDGKNNVTGKVRL